MIDVLMATYNGEKFIREQIDSLINQEYLDFRIIIRDDNSIDRTKEIINEYKEKYPKKIFVVDDDTKCGSAVSNFFALLKYAKSEYVMFCDQDDVWFPNKIKKSYEEIVRIENGIGKNKPILVFGNYIPVDEKLNLIKYNAKNSQIGKYNVDFNRLLVQNYVTGCLSIFNKSLCDLMGKYNDKILMHDYWAALIASSMGALVHTNVDLMYYRQHSKNVVGVVNVKSFSYRIKKMFNSETKKSILKYKLQNELFYDRFKDLLPELKLEELKSFLNIFTTKSKIKRIKMLRKGKFLKSDFIRRLSQYMYI